MSERSRRISIDLDSKARFRLLKTYFNLQYLFRGKPVIVEETRHGYHVKVVDVDRTIQQNLMVRRGLGDDPLRIKYDEFKHKHGLDRFVDTLFTIKKYLDGSTSVVSKIDPLSEPFWNFEFKRPIRRRSQWKCTRTPYQLTHMS